MLIDYVKVENFRSFTKAQTIYFSSDKNQNATVIFALNGVGKTNLLNAILWCLHGEFSPGFRGTNDVLNHQAKRAGRKSYLVEIGFWESDRYFVVQRVGGSNANFKIFESQRGNHVEVARPELFINSIIPKDMAGYFISDGEGEDINVQHDSVIEISRSIRDILGFSVAEATLTDLRNIKAQLRREFSSSDPGTDEASLQSELAFLEEEISTLETKHAKVQGEIIATKAELKDIDAKIFKIRGDANLDKLRRTRAELDSQLKEDKKDLEKEKALRTNLIRRFSWAVYGKGFAGAGLEFIDEAELKGRIPAPFNVQLVKDILEEGKCICGACIKEGSEAYKEIKALEKEGAGEVLINRLRRARSRLTAIQEISPQALTDINENFNRCRKLVNQIERGEDQRTAIQADIDAIDNSQLNKYEERRKKCSKLVSQYDQEIGSCNLRLRQLRAEREKKVRAEASIKSRSARASLLKCQIDAIEAVESCIKSSLEKAESTIYKVLENKINEFLENALLQDYRVKISEEKRLGLYNRYGELAPASGGQGVLLQLIYIASLLSIARERRDAESEILTPGGIAPLILDAPFSKLDPGNMRKITAALANQVEQLIVLMYLDQEKRVDKVLFKEGRLGKVYYFVEERQEDGEGKSPELYELGSEEIPSVEYGKLADRVVIREASL